MSGSRLFYWNESALIEVTDTALGEVRDVTWIDGYFVTTDGDAIVVTELNDPTKIDPLKYGSAERDPDPVTGVESKDEELVVFGRHSIQFFRNVGGLGFPFAGIVGSTLSVGCISAFAKTRIGQAIAFVGSGREEPLGVYVLQNGQTGRISDNTIDTALANCGDPSTIVLETRRIGEEQQLIVHVGDCTFALSYAASQEARDGLWHQLNTYTAPYRPRNTVFVYGAHWVGDRETNALGVLTEAQTAHFGTEPGWSFDAGLLYNDGAGLILRQVEISGLFPQEVGSVFFSMTRDGELWSKEVARRMTGDRESRALWRADIRCRRMVGFRFRGWGKVAISRCDALAEGLAV
jgi:hypothetical protein